MTDGNGAKREISVGDRRGVKDNAGSGIGRRNGGVGDDSALWIDDLSDDCAGGNTLCAEAGRCAEKQAQGKKSK
jgi:hypothetical protein